MIKVMAKETQTKELTHIGKAAREVLADVKRARETSRTHQAAGASGPADKTPRKGRPASDKRNAVSRVFQYHAHRIADPGEHAAPRIVHKHPGDGE